MSKVKHKKITVSVTNDLVTDNRVHKVCSTLAKMGFNVLLIGRLLPNSQKLKPREYQTKRLSLMFTSEPLFYTEYNLRLLIYLLLNKTDILLSNDLDTLAGNFIASKIKRKPLVYDSHEYFTEVPELINRPKTKAIWEWIERRIIPKLKYAYTVCDSIAEIYTNKYGICFETIRNLPYFLKKPDNNSSVIGKKENIILYQGALNKSRGLEQAILAMKRIDKAKLIIAGDGDLKKQLKTLVLNENLIDRVVFKGRLSFEELVPLTQSADLGISVEEDMGLNYRYALPNKLFDYIQARIPVLVTNLPEMASIVRKYEIGDICYSLEPDKLAATILLAMENNMQNKIRKDKIELAASELTWENEEKKIIKIFSTFH